MHGGLALSFTKKPLSFKLCLSEWWVMTFASQQFNALVNFMKLAVLRCVLKL